MIKLVKTNKPTPKKQYLYRLFLGIQPLALWIKAPVGLALGKNTPKSANKIMQAHTASGFSPIAVLIEKESGIMTAPTTALLIKLVMTEAIKK